VSYCVCMVIAVPIRVCVHECIYVSMIIAVARGVRVCVP